VAVSAGGGGGRGVSSPKKCRTCNTEAAQEAVEQRPVPHRGENNNAEIINHVINIIEA
jgi:hypothetical protein